jgi:Flp pilus assembly pilin Flp
MIALFSKSFRDETAAVTVMSTVGTRLSTTFNTIATKL